LVAGTVTNFASLYAAAPETGASIGTTYGLYVESLTAGGTNYAVYTNSGLVRFGDDVIVGSLGRFDSTDTPQDLQLLVYKAGTINKWQAESFQLLYSAGDTRAQVQSDGTTVAYLLNDPGSGADSPAGAPPTPTGTPVLTQTHKAMTIDITDIVAAYTPPADFRYWEVRYSTDNFATVDLLLCYMTGAKAVHGRLAVGTTYYYRVRAVDRAGNVSGYSSTASKQAVANNQVSAFGALIASEISVTSLAAINANMGLITAGQLRNSGNTAGVNLGGAGGIPSQWTTGINFEAGANVSGLTRYLNFAATGSSPFLKHERLEMNVNGVVKMYGSSGRTVFNLTATDYYLQQDAVTPVAGLLVMGTLPGSWTRYVNLNGSGSFVKHERGEWNYDGSVKMYQTASQPMFKLDATDFLLQNDAATPTQGILIDGTLPASWTRYLNLTGTGVMLKHDKLSLNYDGTAKFTGQVDIDSAGLIQTLQNFHILLRDPLVDHGMTSFVETNILGAIGPVNLQSAPNYSGGLGLLGFAEDGGTGVVIEGFAGNAVGNPRGVRFDVWQKAGTGKTAPTAGFLPYEFLVGGVVAMDVFYTRLVRIYNGLQVTGLLTTDGVSGDLVLATNGTGIHWKDTTGNVSNNALVLQGDNNLVLYLNNNAGSARAIWSCHATYASDDFTFSNGVSAVVPNDNMGKLLGRSTQRWGTLYGSNLNFAGSFGSTIDTTVSADYALFVRNSATNGHGLLVRSQNQSGVVFRAGSNTYDWFTVWGDGTTELKDGILRFTNSLHLEWQPITVNYDTAVDAFENPWNPWSGGAKAPVIRLYKTGAGNLTIRGIQAPSPAANRFFILVRVNDGAADGVVFINHEDTAALAANRVLTTTGVQVSLGLNDVACFWYDTASSRWRMLWLQ
jgi:hypothetical protein